jgi:hypothetical protein
LDPGCCHLDAEESMSPRIRFHVVAGVLVIGLSSGTGLAQSPGPKPLPRRACSADQRIVPEIYPIQSPAMVNIRKTDWGGLVDGVATGFVLGGVGGAAAGASRSPKATDYTEEFTRGVTAGLSGVDVEQLLLAAVERAVNGKTPCQTVFVKAEERRSR